MKILLIFYFLLVQNSEYDFSKIYQNDLKNIDTEHSSKDNNKIKLFSKFSTLDVSNFSLEKINQNGFSIKIWSTKNGKIKNIKRALKCIKTADGKCLNFIGYKFIDTRNTYFYISVEGQGLMDYSINNQDYHILNESIISGLDEIYFKSKSELKSVLNK